MTKLLLFIGINKFYRCEQIDKIKDELTIDDYDIQESIENKNLVDFYSTVFNKKFNAIFITYDKYTYTMTFLAKICDKLIDIIFEKGYIFFFNLDRKNRTFINYYFQQKKFKLYNIIYLKYTPKLSKELDVIYEYFNPKTILINGNNSYSVKCPSSNKIEDTRFIISNDNLRLAILSKCGTTTGKSLLLRIIEIAKKLNKKFITLTDVSFEFAGV